MFDEGNLARVAEGFYLRQAELGGELAHFGLKTGARLQSAEEVTAKDMPDGDGEFAGAGYGGFIAAAPGGYGQAPLLQRLLDLERAATVALEGGAPS